MGTTPEPRRERDEPAQESRGDTLLLVLFLGWVCVVGWILLEILAYLGLR